MTGDAPGEGVLVVFVPLAFAVVFPLLWCGIVKLVSVLGGWSALAARYPAGGARPARSWGMKSGTFGNFANYRGVLTVGVGPEGLFLDVMWAFRVGHAPILVPWSEVEIGEDERFFFLPVTSVRFPKAGTRLRIAGGLGEELRRARSEALGS